MQWGGRMLLAVLSAFHDETATCTETKSLRVNSPAQASS